MSLSQSSTRPGLKRPGNSFDEICMANHKRHGTRRFNSSCKMCKGHYKRFAGNSKNRKPIRDLRKVQKEDI